MNNKIKQNKSEYDLDRLTAKILALSLGNLGKIWIFDRWGVLPERDLLEKAGTFKWFEFSPFGSELKKQTDFGKKQYQGLSWVCEFDKADDFKMLKTKLKNKQTKIKNARLQFWQQI